MEEIQRNYDDFNHPDVEAIAIIRGRVLQALQQYLQDIIDEGGEGVILRDPLCLYEAGRSSGYLKHKVLLFYYFNCQSSALLVITHNNKVVTNISMKNVINKLSMTNSLLFYY